MPVERLAKSEFLSMKPEAYAAKMASGGKPRRASLEVALQMSPPPRMGERVTYYLAAREKGQTAEWQRAVPIDQFEPILRGYDAKTYLKKLADWRKRYSDFLPQR
jgi:DNA polymerase I